MILELTTPTPTIHWINTSESFTSGWDTMWIFGLKLHSKHHSSPPETHWKFVVKISMSKSLEWDLNPEQAYEKQVWFVSAEPHLMWYQSLIIMRKMVTWSSNYWFNWIWAGIYAQDHVFHSLYISMSRSPLTLNHHHLLSLN